jgi:sugar lactone lactonase YvrE
MSGSTDDFFNGPAAVAADGLGNLYVADSNNHAIRKVAIATGAITTLAGSPGMSGRADGIGTDARFYFPTGVAADGAGNVYVADTNNCTIRKIVADSHMVTTLASRECTPKDGIGTQAGFIFPGGLALDGAGNLYVADALGDTIRKVVLQGAVTSTLASGLRQYGSAYGRGPATRFNFPTGLALDGRGNLYVTDLHNGTVRKVQLSSGSITTVVGSPGQHGVRLGPLPAGLNMPSVVAVLPRGELIILDESSVLSLR